MALFDRVREATIGNVNVRVGAESRGGDGANTNTGITTGGRSPINPLRAIRARQDPLLSCDWYCEMPFLQGVSGPPNRLPWEMVEEATLPMFEFEPQSNYRAGKTYHYPSHQNLGSLTTKMYEDASGQSTAYVRNWQSLIFDKETGLYNVPSVFKQIISFTLFDVTKLEAITIRYLGCWPQNIDQFQLVGGASERIAPSVTFSVDDIEMTFNKLTSEATQSLLSNVGTDYPSVPNVQSGVFPSQFAGVSGLDV